jgi:steroid 5-alpha reductase family enzyme
MTISDDVEGSAFWMPAVITFAVNMVTFTVASIIKDNSIIDIMWSWGFFIACLVEMIIQSNTSPKAILILVLVGIWCIRLSGYIFVRHNKEDFRYRQMRKDWTEKGGTFGFYWRSLVFIYTLQWILMLVNASSAIYVIMEANEDSLGPFDYVGIVVWFTGFLIELFADKQKNDFKKVDSKSLCKVGLWKYSRHPNYFGEALLWWGIYLIAAPVSDYGWVTFYSALVITLLIRFVSGVPLVEEAWQKREDFPVYKEETNIFFPWFTKKASSQTTNPELVSNKHLTYKVEIATNGIMRNTDYLTFE